MKSIKVVLLVSYMAIVGVCFATSKRTAERSLANFLLNSTIYSPAVRPVANYADTLVIKHGLTIAQLIKVDEKSQIVTTSVLLHLKWHDLHLKWDPALYGGITEFNVDIKLIWYPMIEIFNNADDSLDTIAIPRATVKHDGSITAIMPKILKSTCKIKVKDFPFDRQICELRFGSFQFDTKKMDIQPLYNEVQMDKFQKNAEWKLTKNKVERGLVCHAFSDELSFSQLSYKLQLDRKPSYYTTNFIVPCVLIALITVLLFLIPSDTGEQMAVGVTILLSLAVFFLLLEDKMPETSDHVPLIGKYFACTIVEASLAVAAVCMVLCFHHHDPTDVPKWMRKYILGYLASMLRIKTKENTKNNKGSKGKGGFKLASMKRRATRKSDDQTLKVARKRLLIWQAKARAKRLRREKRQRDAAKLLGLNDDTRLTSLSQEDLHSGQSNHAKARTNKAFEGDKGKKEGARKEKRIDFDEELSDQSGSRRSSSVADDSRVLIKSESNGINQLNIMNRVIKMRDNVRDRFKKKHKDKERAANDQRIEIIENSLFKIKPASDWQEADHKSVKLMADTIKEGDVDDAKKTEWKEVAKVINYFLMWLYIGSLIFTFFVLFGPVMSGTIPDHSL